MDIVYVYQRKRKDFGRHCYFSDRSAEVIVDISPDESLREQYVLKDFSEMGIQQTREFSEHEVNTERFETSNTGINHVEGGWPKDVDPNEVEQVMRYRKKVEKDESYVQTILHLGSLVEHCIKQNNAIDIYEDYFPTTSTDFTLEPPSARTVNVFRDPNPIKRSATALSWYPDGARKLAVAYSVLKFQSAPDNVSLNSYIWDLENPAAPEFTIVPSSPLVSLEYNPKDVHVLAGGQYNGQISIWDLRRGTRPVETSPIEKGHRDPVYRTRFLQSKTGTEFFSCSTDGQVLWWDIRNMAEPTESMGVDPDKNGKLYGCTSLEYEPTMPTKFMVGTEQGVVVAGNRKAKNPGERIVALYPAHIGPIYAIDRNPFFNKFFLSVGDWSARVWCEDIRESSIMWTPPNKSYLTDGCWSPTRASVFLTARSDGYLDVWDLLFQRTSPTLSVQVCESPISAMRIQEQGQYVACGAEDGTVTLLALGESLTKMTANEKQAMSAAFDRDTAREKILVSRMREIALSQKQERAKSAKKEEPQESPEEEALKQAEEAFFSGLEDTKATKRAAAAEETAEAAPAASGGAEEGEEAAAEGDE